MKMTTSELERLEENLRQEQKRKFLIDWLVDTALRNPRLIIDALVMLISIAKWLAETFYDKDGRRITPWWAKVLGFFGVSFTRKAQDLAEEVDTQIRTLKFPTR